MPERNYTLTLDCSGRKVDKPEVAISSYRRRHRLGQKGTRLKGARPNPVASPCSQKAYRVSGHRYMTSPNANSSYWERVQICKIHRYVTFSTSNTSQSGIPDLGGNIRGNKPIRCDTPKFDASVNQRWSRKDPCSI